MSRTLKVILIVFGALIVLGAAAVGGLFWWFSSNQEEFRQMAVEAGIEGQQFGSATTDQGCVEEGLRRTEACDGLMCEVKAGVFLRVCLQSAKVAPVFCAAVPTKDLDSIMETAMWRVGFCQAKGATDVDRCGRVLDAVQKYCHEPRLEIFPE